MLRIRRLLIPLIIICLILTLSVNAQEDGSVSDPWQVANYTELKKVGSGTDNWDLDDYYIQTANIDASDSATENSDGGGGYYGFDPIGDGTNKFTGQYDGNGYTISDLYIHRAATSYIGLFGFLNGATVQNLGLTKCDITGNTNTGGLSGYIAGSSSISNCYVTGSVTAPSNLGGISYALQSSTMTKCYFDGDVEATSGGSIGGFFYSTESSTVSNCYIQGSVTSQFASYVAGFVAYNYKSSISYCYVAASVTSASSYNGGFCGRKNTGSPYADTENYWDTTIGLATSAMGTGKTTAQMKDIDTYTSGGNWDMVAIASWTDENWYIDDGNDYPHLGWEGGGGGGEAVTNVLFIFSTF